MMEIKFQHWKAFDVSLITVLISFIEMDTCNIHVYFYQCDISSASGKISADDMTWILLHS